jgi:hypothetical protein
MDIMRLFANQGGVLFGLDTRQIIVGCRLIVQYRLLSYIHQPGSIYLPHLGEGKN